MHGDIETEKTIRLHMKLAAGRSASLATWREAVADTVCKGEERFAVLLFFILAPGIQKISVKILTEHNLRLQCQRIRLCKSKNVPGE